MSSMKTNEARRIVMLTYGDAQILDVVGPLEVFARASRWLVDHDRVTDSPYRVEIVSHEPGPVVTSSSMRVFSECSYRTLKGRIDTLLVSGGIGCQEAAKNEALLNWIRSMEARVRRIGSICSGALILAAAGLLEGKRVTTHWAYCEQLASLSTNIEVDKDAIFVSDGRLYTSAGVTTGMDMALAMVEEDWGAPVALAVAKELVLYLKRPGEEHQLSRQLQAQLGETSVIARNQEWILDNLDQDLSVKALAQRVAMSERNFSRRFQAETGVTPGQYVGRVRVEAAQRRLQNGSLTIKQVARLCGFANEEALRRTFHRFVGDSPSSYRNSRRKQH